MYSNLVLKEFLLIIVLDILRQDYLEKFNLKGVGEIWLIDGVDGSDSVSGSDEDVVSEEISIGSLVKIGSPCVNECVVQYGSRDVWFGGLKGFSRICSDVGVEPK